MSSFGISWLGESLLGVGVEDNEVIAEYVLGLLADDLPRDERRQAIRDLVEASADSARAPDDWDAYVCGLMDRHDAEAASLKQAQEGAASGKVAAGFEQALEMLAVRPEELKRFVPAEQRLSADDLARRKALLNQYELVETGAEELDENGNPILPPQGTEGRIGGAGVEQDDTMEMFKNTNVLAFSEAQRLAREKKAADEARARSMSKQAQRQADRDRAERKEQARNKKAASERRK